MNAPTTPHGQWWTQARRWLAPPVFAGQLLMTRQASLVNMISLTCLAFIVVVMCGAALEQHPPVVTLLIDAFAFGVIVQFLRWLRSGKVLQARLGLVLFGYVYMVGATASLGTIRTPTASIFVFWVLMTGLLFGRTGIWLGTMAASLAVAGLIIAQNAEWLPLAKTTVSFTQWVTFTAVFGFTSGLTHFIVKNMESALALAEQELERRTKTEAHLLDSEQRYRTLVDWMPAPLLVHHGDVILFANQAALRLFGAPPGQTLVGSPIMERIHADHHLQARARKQHLEQSGEMTTPVLTRLLRLDGVTIEAEVQTTPIRYGDAPAWLTSMHDVTERRSIESKLEEARHKAESANEAKSRFLASASHDLRQPAHALGMFVSRLSGIPTDAPTRHLVDCMDASVRAMQDMLDGLFDLSTLESQKDQFRSSAFPIENLLEQLRRQLEEAAQHKGLQFRVRTSGAWVHSNPEMLYRVLLNLAHNAIRYTESGGILVACRPVKGGTQLRIEVRDSGIGIDPQHHEQVFQEFYQVNNPQRDRNNGMGIGLSIVQRACDLLGHPIHMQSKLHCGTRFSVIVPLVAPDALAVNTELPSTHLDLDFRGTHILLIEDDDLGRQGVAGLLESWGCQVQVADSAKAAIESLNITEAPDVIISDYRLGGGVHGIEAVTRIRNLLGLKVPACIISGDTDTNLQPQALAADVVLLQKPVRPAKLRNLLRRLRMHA